MHLGRLRIENLRVIEQLEIEFDSGWNLLTGPNGAGKTSLLEAVFLLSHGRSFRGSARDALVRTGSAGYSIFGERIGADQTCLRVGVARSGQRLEARLDGEVVPAVDLLRDVAVVCFEPGSRELIAGASEERRRFLDWGVFHVEPGFLAIWRRYQRGLRQRNALLRSGSAGDELDSWDHELGESAAALTAMRQRYFDDFARLAVDRLTRLLPELGAAVLRFNPGYDAGDDLALLLSRSRERDLARGHTGLGPHRADWSLGFERAPRREHLSRGQEKLSAFACVMAQAEGFRAGKGQWPILAVDDLASEVDREHQHRVIEALLETGAQVLATGTQAPEGLASHGVPVAAFHVEQGRATRLL